MLNTETLSLQNR